MTWYNTAPWKSGGSRVSAPETDDHLGLQFRIRTGNQRVDLCTARRIASCVNAFRGIDQSILDAGWTAVGAIEHAKRLEEQNAALLAVAKALVADWDAPNSDSGIGQSVYDAARAAIAKAAGEAS